jgi:hypothetical protein
MEVDISIVDMCELIALVKVAGDMSGRGDTLKRINKKLNESIGLME